MDRYCDLFRVLRVSRPSAKPGSSLELVGRTHRQGFIRASRDCGQWSDVIRPRLRSLARPRTLASSELQHALHTELLEVIDDALRGLLSLKPFQLVLSPVRFS